MEVEKRKRLNDVEVPGKKARTAAEEVAEEEVEEFFAILRRIHVAVKYFGNANGESGGRKATAETAVRPWNPSFRREDFEERAEAETVMENTNTGLDLNSEPDCQPTSPDKKPV